MAVSTPPPRRARSRPPARDRLLPRREVLQQVPVHASTLFEMIKRGQFPTPVKIGRRSFWRESEVQRYIRSLRPASNGEGS